ncbi:MAG: hypothetical protein WD876_02250 [Candidatus Pacearchaeota archaeon]
MKRRIVKKLQKQGKWNYEYDCPAKDISRKTFISGFLGELTLLTRYMSLQETHPSHSLLTHGYIERGHFEFNDSFYKLMGIQSRKDLTSTHIIRYSISLSEATDEGRQ